MYFLCSSYFSNASPAEVWWRSNTIRGLVGCVFVGRRQASLSYRTRQLRATTLVTLYLISSFYSFFILFGNASPAEVWWRSNTVRGLVGCVFVGHRQASLPYRARQLRVVTLVTYRTVEYSELPRIHLRVWPYCILQSIFMLSLIHI